MALRPAGRFQLARLDAFSAEADLGWMTADEAARLAGMHSPERRLSFIAGHKLARDLAAGWLDVDVQRLALDRHPDGRPLLLLDGTPAPLFTSLSHSGEWIVAAIATVPVGVDVEVPRRQRDFDALARHAFSADEVERLQALLASERIGEFHQIWALKEARGKRTGEGFLPGRSRQLTSMPTPDDSADAISWRLGDGALAIALEPGGSLDIDDRGLLTSRSAWRFRDHAEP